MDECFHLSYPHIRERLLSIAEKFDKDNYQVYMKSNDVCCSFTAACQILTADENKSQVNSSTEKRNSSFEVFLCLELYEVLLKHADEALLGLPYHLNFNVVKRFVNICSKMLVEEI